MEYLENQILIAFQIPRMIVFRDSSSPIGVARIIANLYVLHIAHIQDVLGWTFERGLLKRIAALHGFDEKPRIEWQRPKIARILIDSGYGKSILLEYLEPLKNLQKLGILSKEELEQILKKYGFIDVI